MTTPSIIRSILRETDHRPWPLPKGPWAMAMRWHSLLFMHWPIEAERLRKALPGAVELETFDGRAWLGVTPLGMSGVRVRGLPAVWPVHAFPELNVRTYVTVGGKPGVWFFSLDAASRLAVRAARWTFGLPYFDARMRLYRNEHGATQFESERIEIGAPPATLEVRYRPTGPPGRVAPGSLEQFLYERYCLYTVDRRGRPWRGEIHHAPWPVRPAAAALRDLDVTRLAGLSLEGEPTVVHYADALDVAAWGPHRA